MLEVLETLGNYGLPVMLVGGIPTMFLMRTDYAKLTKLGFIVTLIGAGLIGCKLSVVVFQEGIGWFIAFTALVAAMLITGITMTLLGTSASRKNEEELSGKRE